MPLQTADTTERDNSLLHAGMLTESFTEPVMLLDRLLCITAWNKMCEAMCNYPAASVLGRPFFALFPGAADNPRVIKALQSALDGHNSFLTAEDGYQDVKGYFDNHFMPVKNNEGEVIGIMHLRHDVAHRIKALASLQQLNDELVQKNRELTKLSSMLHSVCKAITSGLSEPLHRICNFTGMLLNGDEINLSDKGRTYFRKIKKWVGKSKELTDGLLRYITLDEENATPEPIDLNQLFLFIRDTMSREIDKANALLVWTSLPWIYGCRYLVTELFTELICNALKFCNGENQPVISISGGYKNIELLAEDRPEVVTYAWVSVADNGPGIREKYAGEVFRLFYKAPGFEQYPGHGLGLARCKKIMEKTKGTIRLISEPGTGATFTCCFPVAREDRPVLTRSV